MPEAEYDAGAVHRRMSRKNEWMPMHKRLRLVGILLRYFVRVGRRQYRASLGNGTIDPFEGEPRLKIIRGGNIEWDIVCAVNWMQWPAAIAKTEVKDDG